MKILAISDQPSDGLWCSSAAERLEGIDLILSCGDLDPDYLSFLASFTSAPVLYVHGNHDGRYLTHPPEGCICIDDQIYRYQGLRILGLGGSIRYSSDGAFQYTQAQMRQRVWKQWLALRRSRGFDLLLTHAPAYGLGDGDDRPHMGFEVFRELLERWEPPFFVHGHAHMTYSYKQKRLSYYNKTQIINAFERHVFDVDVTR